MEEIWRCPLCSSAFSGEAVHTLTCANGHSFDRAKQGYVNLLPVNKKRSLEPGDNAQMIDARRTFLSSGAYDFLMSELVGGLSMLIKHKLASAETDTLSKSLRVLDIGCGEGSYLRFIHDALKENSPLADGVHFYGIDVSKAAVKRAATWVKAANFAVASSYDIPTMPNTIDVALNIFAPVSTKALKPVLAEEGSLIRVSPGPDHLKELKALILHDAKAHKPPKALEGMRVVSSHQVSQQVNLSHSQLNALITMTPLNWRGASEVKTALLEQAQCVMTCDFIVQELTFDA